MTIRKKYFISLLASFAACTHMGAQTIGGGVFGGGQNADVIGNTTVVALNNLSATGTISVHGASVYSEVTGNNKDDWKEYLQEDTKYYDYNRFGLLYVKGVPYKTKSDYVNAEGGNILDVTKLSAGTTYQIYSDAVCVAGGGEYGDVTGNTLVEIYSGVYGHANDLIRSNVGSIVGGGLYGTVGTKAGEGTTQVYPAKMPDEYRRDYENLTGKTLYPNFSAVLVDGRGVDVYGDVYGGGYGGDVLGSTFVRTETGYLRNVFGGGVQADVMGRTHLMIGSQLSKVTSIHVSRFNYTKYENSKPDDQADLREIGTSDNLYGGENTNAYGANTLILSGSVFGGGAYGQVGESLSEADVKEMAASTITMNSGYVGYIPGGAPHHSRYDGNETIEETCKNPYTLYQNKYVYTEGHIHGGGYGASTTVPNTKITINSGFISCSIYGGGESGDIGLVKIPASYFTDNSVDLTDSDIRDHYRMCTGRNENIIEIPAGRTPADGDGIIYFKKVFADTYADGSDASDITIHGNSQYMVRHGDERVNNNYHVTRVDGTHVMKASEDLVVAPVNPLSDSGNTPIENPSDRECGFKAELNGSYYIYDKSIKDYVLVNDNEAGWMTDVKYNGNTYDAQRFKLKGKNGAEDIDLAPSDYYNLCAVMCVAGGGNEGDVFGNTNVNIDGGSFGTVITEEEEFYGEVAGGCFDGFVNGNTNIKIGGYTDIYGTVYGGGINGNIDGNTHVDITSGYIREVYGGGKFGSVGWYLHKDTDNRGNTYVTLSPDGTADPHTGLSDKLFISRNVYGGSAFGIVRADAHVTMTGGRIGWMPDYDTHSSVNIDLSGGESNYLDKKQLTEVDYLYGDGNVFGAGFGNTSSVIDNAYVKVESKDMAHPIYIKGSVYGGGRQGCVGMGFIHVPEVKSQAVFDAAKNVTNNASPGKLYYFVDDEDYVRGKTGYLPAEKYIDGVDYYMAVKHVKPGEDLEHWGDEYGNTNVYVAANDGHSSEDGKVFIGGAVIGGCRGYNTIYEGNHKYTKTEAMYIGYVLNDTHVTVGSGNERKEGSIEVHGGKYYMFHADASEIETLTTTGEYNNLYFQRSEWVFYPLFQQDIKSDGSYYTKGGATYTLVNNPDVETLKSGGYYMRDYLGDYLQINPDTTTTESMAAAIKAMTKEGGCSYDTRLYVLDNVYSVVGGGEDGNVIGDTFVDVTNGTMGYQDEDDHHMLGDVIAGGLNGHVMGYTRLSVNGQYVYILGDCYGGGYNGVVRNTTKSVAEVMTTGMLDPDSPEQKEKIATELKFRKGMARDIYGGNCYSEVVRGDTHLQVGDNPADQDGKASADHYAVIAQSAYGGSCFANVNGESVVDMYNGIVGYSRQRYISYYNAKYEGEGNDPNNYNDVLVKDTWLKNDNNGNPTDNYLGENYWWYADFREGNVFGSGYGEDSRSEKTTVNIYGGRIRNSVYGGGEMGNVNGDANRSASGTADEVLASKGVFLDKGAEGADLSAGHYTLYNKEGDTYTKSSDGTYYRPVVATVNIYGGLVGDCIFGGGKGVADVVSADVYGSTMVNIKGGEWIVRSNRAELATDPYLCNTFAAGRVKANVYGDTFLNIEKTMCGAGSVSANAKSPWVKLYTKWYSSKYCAYGGGYGKQTSVYGNTNVLMDIKSGEVDVDKNTTVNKLSPYRWQSLMDLVGGGYEGSVDGSTYVTVDGKAFVRTVYGGGFFAKVGTEKAEDETTYSTSANVTLKAGCFESVYGGGFLSDVHGETNLDYGVYNAANDHLFTRFNVFGGNNVSGNIAGSSKVDFGSHINIYGGTIGNEEGIAYIRRDDLGGSHNVKNLYYKLDENVDIREDNYTPVVDADGNYNTTYFDQKITTITVDGKELSDTVYTVKTLNDDGSPADIVIFEKVKVGNVYGAGNGDYPGFYKDGLLAKETGHSYEGKKRPNVASAMINVVGTKEHPAVINGAVYGGGNASTVGFFESISFKPKTSSEFVAGYNGYYYDYSLSRSTPGKVHINIGGYAKIKDLFLGSNGECLIDNLSYHVYKSVQRDLDNKVTNEEYLNGFVNPMEFSNYMQTAAMACVPKLTFNKPGENGKGVFEETQDAEHDNTADEITIGSFYVGGNIGSMMSDGVYEYTLPEGVTITDKIVGGSNNANFKYTQFYSPNPVGSIYGIQSTDTVSIAPKGWSFSYEGGLNGGMRNESVEKVKLNLLCKFEPTVGEKTDSDGDKYTEYSGCMVYGGCYQSGSIFGNVDIYSCSDLLGSHSAYPLVGAPNFFNKVVELIGSAKDIDQKFSTIFGGGYGEDTEVTGSTNINLQVDRDNKRFPVVNRIFGGGDMGVVRGNTKITINAGLYGAAFGKVYGGGFHGLVGGNTEMYLNSGNLVGGTYGGGRMANVNGTSYIRVEDTEEEGHIIMESLYGGCDISGEVKGTGTFVTHDGDKATVNSFISVAESKGEKGEYTGFPFIGHLYGGSDGHYATIKNGRYTEDFTNEIYGNHLTLKGVAAPRAGSAYIDITGGTVGNVYGGGNNVTVDGETTINFDNKTDAAAVFKEEFLLKTFLYMIRTYVNIYTGYHETEDGIVCEHQVASMFGGNNTAPMYIQPKWKLTQGTIGNLYSGGNRGEMFYYNKENNAAEADGTPGIALTIDSPDMYVDNVYGGCRMADVRPYELVENTAITDAESLKTALAGDDNVYVMENGMARQCVSEQYDDTVKYYHWQPAAAFVANKYGAVLNILDGMFEHVYGGNDVSGVIYDGTNVNISGAISGNVYGAGNGNYLYMCDPDVTKITEVDHPADTDLPELFFSIPFHGTTDVEKIAAVNAIRPNVSKSYLNIEGKNGKIAYVKGNIYNGGNASTIISTDPEVKATSLFNIGNDVTVNGVYLGSDGQALVDGTTINNFKKINKINTLSAPVTKAECDKYGLGYYESPTLLTLYMKAVETNAMPVDFKLRDDLEHANIGTFCCGGNRGSVVAADPVALTFPSGVNIFSHIIGGCNNANFTYDGVTHKGGFVAPNNDKSVDKIHFTVNSHFMPKKMDVEKGTAENDYLVDDVTDGLYGETCNIYGGCYLSGSVLGKVTIDMHSNLLENADLDILDKTNKKEVPAFSVFGAGFGTSSWNVGGVTLNMSYDEDVANTVKSDAPIKAAPVVNNFFGGGQQGNLIGNATLNIKAGQVYNDVCGGSLAGYLYGSTQILVGYPQYYICNTTAYYSMKRGDTSADNLQLKNETLSRDETGQYKKNEATVLRQQVRYVKGDIVPANIYQMIKDYDESQASHFTLQENAHTWTDNDNVWLRKGVYGGGYAHVSGFNVYAGSYTVCKYTDKYNLTQLNKVVDADGVEQTPGTDFVDNIDYGGNTCVIVSDDRSADSEKDHITISTEVHREVKMNADDDVMGYYLYEPDNATPSANKYVHQHTGKYDPSKKYYTFDGDGGIYGDGRMVFAEGIRAVDIYNYGYASYTPQYPKLLNTFQRCDIVSVTDCCLQLQGAQDFATNSVDATTYAITRINELRLNSTIDDNNSNLVPHTGNNDVLDVKKSRNYLGLFHNIHYLGSLVSNTSFDDKWHTDKGVLDASKTYREYKQDIINEYLPHKDEEVSKDATETTDNYYEKFKKRNIGTSKNLIGINNGYCLKIQNCYTTVDAGNHVIDHIYYGPVEGVVEVRLLTLIPGEGGGYIYADNVHDETKAEFLNVSGNFVFPGMAHTAGIAPQHIVDDCFPTGFYNKKGVDAPKEDVHYWYVEGNLYFYSSTITGYTYTSPTGEKSLNFDMNNVDQIITLSGTSPKPNKVVLKSVRWHSDHDTSEGYQCDLENEEKTGYKLMMTVSTNNTYNPDDVHDNKICYYNDIPRHSNYHAYDLAKDKIDTEYVAEFVNKDKIADYSPLLAIRLNDTQNDNGGRENYQNRMCQPDYLQLILQSEVHDPDYPDDETQTLVYTYVVNLTIKYVLGPMVTGTLSVKNCALPGEIINVSKTEVTVDADESMPVTNSYWKILPKVADDKWTDVQGGEFVDQYVNLTTGDLELPAKYMYDGAKVEYFIETSNYVFPVEAPHGDNLVVHNYHRMQKVASLDKDGNIAPQLSVIPGSRIYIKDKTDLERFRMYIDYCNGKQEKQTIYAAGDNTTTRDIIVNPDNCEGLKFYFQDNLTPDKWTVPTNAFKGELNGDGYVIDLSKTAATSMLNANDGSIYNLGVVGKKMAASNSGLIMNSFSYGADITGANTGMVANSYQNVNATGGAGTYAKTELFNDGTVAYNLNKYYLDKRYVLKGTDDQPCSAFEKEVDENDNVTWNLKNDEDHAAYKYIYDYYRNGDYRYAKVRDIMDTNHVYLRTEDEPNYDNGDGKYSTFHITTHENDPRRARYQSGNGNDATLTTQAEGNTFVLNEPVYPDDYIFFGQRLVYSTSSSHNKYPVHINQTSEVDNRVYRASGFYGTKQDKGVHFNHKAAFNNAELTAIDLTCQRDNEAVTKYVKGYRDASDQFKASQDVFYAPVADYDGISAFSLVNDKITRNLLVYTSKDETQKEYTLVDNVTRTGDGTSVVKYDQNTEEKNILAHHMTIETEGTTATPAKAKAARGLFHLVDKQDFNSPIAFDVDTRAWYERKPECLNEGHNDGWESICLPFTVKKVTAKQVDNTTDHKNYFSHGEITHFYGTESDKANYDTESPTDATKYNTDHNQMGHEYWLRGFTDYADTDNTLTFMRPTPKNGAGFYDDRINGSTFDYVYDNSYLAGVTDDKNGYSYYDSSHTYNAYMPLTADVPFIISYPGTYFYEFNMTGEKMTYENPSVTVGVTDDGNQSSDYNGYEYFGTFKHLTPTAENPLYFAGALAKKNYAGDCFMLSDVNETDADGNALGTIYPFRGYFKAAKASGAKMYLPFAGTRLADNEPSQPMEEEIGGMRIWVEKRTLCIDSPKDIILNLYTVDGIFQRRLDVKEGANRFDIDSTGVYIVHGKKYFIR